MVLHVDLPDGTSKAVPVLTETLVQDLITQTANKIGLRNTTGFGLFCTQRGVVSTVAQTEIMFAAPNPSKYALKRNFFKKKIVA